MAWRNWLHMFNTMQTLPGVWLATVEGLEGHDHVHLSEPPLGEAVGIQPEAAQGGAWQEVQERALKPLQVGLGLLAARGADVPELGMELADDAGKVLADAELCWPAVRLAVLRDDQADLTPVWQEAGWQTWVLDERMACINGLAWYQAVADGLGLKLTEKGIHP